MFPETNSNVANAVVVAYFADSSDAQRALDDLQAEGFEPRQMGAAFRSRNAASPNPAAVTDTGEIGSKTGRSAIDSDTVGSGPASDTRAVTPAGLSSGSGSVISGVGRPGPIPGSDIPHHRSTSLAGTAPTAANPLPATGSFHESHNDDSWWQKLKNFFSSDAAVEGRKRGVANETSMNFGNAEGHLATIPDNYDYAYSGSAFEGAFSGMGVKQSHASSLAGDLSQGGAIVSVHADERLADAERILHRNKGRIRYEAAAETAHWSDTPGERVRVFGQLSRTYPGFSDRIERLRPQSVISNPTLITERQFISSNELPHFLANFHSISFKVRVAPASSGGT